MVPRVLRNFNAFVNGIGYAGRINEVELPEVSIKQEEHRGGGMDAPRQIDMGMEAMTAKLTFAEYIREVLSTFGSLDSNATRITFRGAIQRDAETPVPVVCELGGSVSKSTMGTWKAGDAATHEVEMSVNYYKLTIGADEVYEIDVDNMIRRVNGEDRLAGIRAAIGM